LGLVRDRRGLGPVIGLSVGRRGKRSRKLSRRGTNILGRIMDVRVPSSSAVYRGIPPPAEAAPSPSPAQPVPKEAQSRTLCTSQCTGHPSKASLSTKGPTEQSFSTKAVPTMSQNPNNYPSSKTSQLSSPATCFSPTC